MTYQDGWAEEGRGGGQGQQRRFRKKRNLNLSRSAVTVGTLGMSVNSALPQFLSCEMSGMGKISELICLRCCGGAQHRVSTTEAVVVA